MIGLVVLLLHGGLASLIFEPGSLSLRRRDVATLTVSYSGPHHHLTPDALSLDTDIATVQAFQPLEDQNGTANYRLSIRGVFLGRTKVRITARGQRTNTTSELEVKVLRSWRGMLLGQVFTLIMAILIAVNTFLMGTQLDANIIRDTLHYPVGPAIGMACQFLLMPILAFVWGRAILENAGGYLSLGYFAIGCSPGGGNSNFWTILLDGNLDLSVTMTFLSSIFAFFAMPAWFYTLGRYVHEDAIGIPFWNMGGSLAILVLPCLAGFAFAHYYPIWKASSLVMLGFVLTVGSAANFYVFSLIRWETVLAGFLLPWTGYAIAALIALLAKRNYQDCLTIAIETGIQNGGVSILVLRFSLEEPESDLTLVMPICVMLFTSVPLWILFAYRIAKNRWILQNGSNESVMFNSSESTMTNLSQSNESKAIDFYAI